MANNIETLKKYVIDVEVSTQKATAELDKLQKKVDKGVNSGQIKKDTQASINQIEGMIKELSNSIAKESESIKNGLKNGLSGIKTKDLEEKFAAVDKSINGVIDKINLLSSTLNSSDFAKFERFVDAFTVPLQDLNKTVADLNTTLTALTEPLQTISKMKVGAIDTKAFEQSVSSLKPITEKAKKELINSVKELSEELGRLYNNGEIDIESLGATDAAEIKQVVARIFDRIKSESKKYSFSINDIFSEAQLGFDDAGLKKIANGLDRKLAEILPEGKERSGRKSGISASTTIQLKPTAELSDDDVNKFVEELSTKIETKVQSKLSEKVGVKIPIKPDTVGLKKLVEKAISEYNRGAQEDSGAKVDVPINVTIDEKSLNLVRSKIQDQISESGGIGFGNTTNIGDIGGIATETTLSQIRDILEKGITVAVGSMDGNVIQSIKADPKEEALLKNFDYLLTHSEVNAGKQAVKSKYEAQYNLERETEKFYNQLLDSFGSYFKGYYKDSKQAKTPMERLHKSDLYSATVGETGDYAKYGRGLKLEEHQKALDDVLESTYNAIKTEVDVVKEKYQALKSSDLSDEAKRIAAEEIQAQKDESISAQKISAFKSKHSKEVKEARDKQIKLDQEEIKQLEKEESIINEKTAALKKKISEAKTDKTRKKYQKQLDDILSDQTNKDRLAYLKTGQNHSEEEIIKQLIWNKGKYDKLISDVKSSSEMTGDIKKFLDAAAQRAISEIVSKYTKNDSFSVMAARNAARGRKNAAAESLKIGNGDKTIGKTLEQEILKSFTTATRSKLDKSSTNDLLRYIFGSNDIFSTSFDKAGNIVNSMATSADKANAVSMIMKQIDEEAASTAKNYEQQRGVLEQIKTLQNDKDNDNTEEIQRIKNEHEGVAKLLADSTGVDDAINSLDKLYRSFINRFNSAKKELATSVFSEIDSESKYRKTVAKYQEKQQELSLLSGLSTKGEGFTPYLKGYLDSLKKIVPELRAQISLYEDINNIEDGIVRNENSRLSLEKETKKELSDQSNYLKFGLSKEGNAAYSRTANLGGATDDIIKKQLSGMTIEELNNVYKDLSTTNDEMTKSLEKYGDMDKLVSERAKSEVSDIIKFLEKQKKQYEDLIRTRTKEYKERGATYNPESYQKKIAKIQEDINYYKTGTGKDNKELADKRKQLEELIILIDEYKKKEDFTGKENEYLDMLEKRRSLEESIGYLSSKFENEKGEALSFEEGIKKKILKESEEERSSIQSILNGRLKICELAEQELAYRKEIESIDTDAEKLAAQKANKKANAPIDKQIKQQDALLKQSESKINETYKQFESNIKAAEKAIATAEAKLEAVRKKNISNALGRSDEKNTPKEIENLKNAKDALSLAKEKLKVEQEAFETAAKRDIEEREAYRHNIDDLKAAKKANDKILQDEIARLDRIKEQQQLRKESQTVSVVKTKKDEIAEQEAAEAKARAKFESLSYDEQIAKLEKQISKASGEEKQHLQDTLRTIKEQYVAELNLVDAQKKQNEAAKETSFSKEKAAKQAEKEAIKAGTITSPNGTVTGNIALGDVATESTSQKILAAITSGKITVSDKSGNKSAKTDIDELNKSIDESSKASKRNSSSKKEESDATDKASKSSKVLGTSLKTIQEKINKSTKPGGLNDNNYRKRLNSIGSTKLSPEALNTLAAEGVANGFIAQQRGNKLRFQQPWTNKQITDEDIALTNKYRDAENQLTRAILDNERALHNAANAQRRESEQSKESIKDKQDQAKALNKYVNSLIKSKQEQISLQEIRDAGFTKKQVNTALGEKGYSLEGTQNTGYILKSIEANEKAAESKKKNAKASKEVVQAEAEEARAAEESASKVEQAESRKKTAKSKKKKTTAKDEGIDIDAIIDEINVKTEKLIELSSKYGAEVVDKFARGIKAATPEEKAAFEELAQIGIDTVKNILGIHSPSEVFERLGFWVDQGLANGIKENADVVKNALLDMVSKGQLSKDELQSLVDWNGVNDNKKSLFKRNTNEGKQYFSNFNEGAKAALAEYDTVIKEEEKSVNALNKAFEELIGQQIRLRNLEKSGNVSNNQLTDEAKKADELKNKYNELLESFGKSFSPKDTPLNKLHDSILKDTDNLVAQYQKKIEKMGISGLSEFKSIYEEIKTASSILSDKSVAGIESYIEEIDKLQNKLKELLSTIDSEDASKFDVGNRLLGSMNNAGFLNDKIDLFKNSIKGLSEEWRKLQSEWQGTDDQKRRLNELVDEIQILKKTASQYKETIGGKSFVDIDAGQIKSVDQLRDAMTKLAEQRGYSSVRFKKYNAEQRELTMICKDEKGQLIQLSGAIGKVNNSLYAGQPVMQQNLSFWKSYGDTLKRAFSTFGYYLGFAALVRKTMQEFRQGITTLKEFDSALTTISYTMDLSQKELKDLGLSAVEMAEDLSMSMENALKIYQIYANMQTTAEEIQEVARPTAILSNLSGVDASTAADQVQGILQQFNMLKDGEEDVAETSMHVVDVLDKISANVAVDYSKGIGIISEAVTATGQVAHDAGMSFEELAAITAKVAERTREDGSTIGNAMKTMFTRISKVSKMPQYADEVDNEQISKAAKALHDIGIEVYNSNGEFNNITDTLTQLNEKWGSLNDVQKSNISFQVAATRQSAKFKSMLEAWTGAMDLANEATNANGNALANQEKYEESYAGKLQKLETQWKEFWLNLLNSDGFKDLLDALINVVKWIDKLGDSVGHVKMVVAGLGLASLINTLVKLGAQWVTNTLALKASGVAASKAAKEYWELAAAEQAAAMAGKQQATDRAFNSLLLDKDFVDMSGEIVAGTGAMEAGGAATAASFATMAAVILAVVAAIGIGVAAFNHFNVTVEEVKSEIEDAETKISSLNTEIQELESIENKTTAQQNRLKLLRKELDVQNQILESKQRLLLLEQTGTKSTDRFDLGNYNTMAAVETGHLIQDKSTWSNIWGYFFAGFKDSYYETAEDVLSDINTNTSEYNRIKKEFEAIDEEINSDAFRYYDESQKNQLLNSRERHLEMLQEAEEALSNSTIIAESKAAELESVLLQMEEDGISKDTEAYKTIEEMVRKLKESTNIGKKETGTYDFFETDEFYDAIYNNSDALEELINSEEDEFELKKKIEMNYPDLLDLMDKEGISIDVLIQKYKELSEEKEKSFDIDKGYSKSEMINSITDLSDGFDKLDEIYADVLDKGAFDFTRLSTKKFEEAFQGLEDEYTEFIETVSANPNDLEATQSAFNKLVGAYINNSGVLKGLNKDNKELTANMLKNMGVANAEALVEEALADKEMEREFSEKLLAKSSKDVTEANLEEIDSLIKEGKYTDEAKNKIYAYALEKRFASGVNIRNNDDLDFLTQMAYLAGVASEAIEGLEKARAAYAAIKDRVNHSITYSDGSSIAIEYDKDSFRQGIERESQNVLDQIKEKLNATYTPEVQYAGADKTKSAIDKANKSGEESKEIFDWIEKALQRQEEEINRIDKVVNATYKNWSKRNSSLLSEITEINKEIAMQRTAYQAYMRDAEAIPLSEEYKKLVREGAMKSEIISDKTLKKNIKEYEELYDKAIKAKDAVADLESKIAALAKAKFDNVKSEFEGFTSEIEHFVNMIDKELSHVENMEKIAGKSFYTAKMDQDEQRLEELNKERTALVQALHDAEANGVEAGSADWIAMRNDIYSVDEAIADLTYELENLKKKLKEVAKLNFDDLKSQFENAIGIITGQIDLTDAVVSMTQNAGYIASREYYKALIEGSKENVTGLRKEYETLSKTLADAMNAGDIEKYDKQWYAMQGDISNVKKELVEAANATIEYANALRQIDWDVFDRGLSRIKLLVDESEFFQELMSWDDKLKDDNGDWTKKGLVKQGLIAQDYQSYMDSANAYGAEAEEIRKLLETDPKNTTLIDRYHELLGLQRDSILAALKEKKALTELIKEGYDELLKRLKKLIDEYKEALDSAKSLMDYSNTIDDKTKKITDLQKQITAYSGDAGSEETRATLQRLNAQLGEAQKDLEQTEYDKYIEDQKSLLDDFYSDLEEYLDGKFQETEVVFEEAIANINENGKLIDETLHEEASSVNYRMTDEFANIWDQYAAEDGIAAGTLNILTLTNEVTTDIRAKMEELPTEARLEEFFNSDDLRLLQELTSVRYNTAGMIDAINSTNAALDQIRSNIVEYSGILGNKIDYAGQAVQSAINSLEFSTGSSGYNAPSGGGSGGGGSSSSSTTKTQTQTAAKKFKVLDEYGNVYQSGIDTAVHASQIANTYKGHKLDQLSKAVSSGMPQSEYNRLKALYNKIKVVAYAKGGSIGKDTTILDSIARLLGEDHMVAAKEGERILTKEQNKNFEKMVNANFTPLDSTLKDKYSMLSGVNGVDIASMMANMPTPQVGNNANIGNTTTIGDINISLPNVTNKEEFINWLKNDGQIERILQAMTVGRLTGGNSYTKMKY